METYSKRQYLRLTLWFLSAFVLMVVVFKKIVNDNPVFNFVPSEEHQTSWEQFLSQREKLNARQIKKSYAELMELGKNQMENDDWAEALQSFFYAKTLYPDRIGPRKNLCYCYLMLCQEDWRYCDKGKKELYYAMRYVNPEDKISYEYLNHLVEIVRMEDIVEMEEREALSAIF